MKKEKKIRNKKTKYKQLQIYHSHPIKLDTKKQSEFYRADLEFHGIGHATESHTGHVFLNNHDANLDTARTLENGYVGSYHIFGHGGCFGDLGHCDIVKKDRKYDFRAEFWFMIYLISWLFSKVLSNWGGNLSNALNIKFYFIYLITYCKIVS